MTTRNKTLDQSSLSRISYEENEIARIEAAIAAGKGNKRSQGALEKKRALIEKIKRQMTARAEKRAAKGVAAQVEHVVVTGSTETDEAPVTNDMQAALEAAMNASNDTHVDELTEQHDEAHEELIEFNPTDDATEVAV